jgi:hypothetical protein
MRSDSLRGALLVGIFFTGKLATGHCSARAEGIANHSTGDLNGLVASAHQPG